MKQIVLPSYKNIPDVGLYLDQTVRFLNQYTSLFEGELTGSMVTNYVKLKIVPKAKGKMYDRSQIAMFFMIAICKRVLSMEQIKMVFAFIGEDIEGSYEAFRCLLAGGNVDRNEKREVVRKVCEAILVKRDLDEYIAGL